MIKRCIAVPLIHSGHDSTFKWMSETADSTEPYIYYIFFMYVHIYSLFKGGTLQILFGISNFSTLASWGHY